jgi:hypothetical protein
MATKKIRKIKRKKEKSGKKRIELILMGKKTFSADQHLQEAKPKT